MAWKCPYEEALNEGFDDWWDGIVTRYGREPTDDELSLYWGQS